MMTEEAKTAILNALDALGLALANHLHQWSAFERMSYERAVTLLKSAGIAP